MITYIGLKAINNVTPAGFNDYIITDEIPVYDGVFEIELETESLVKLKAETDRSTRKVQQIFYPKYSLKIYESTEHQIEILKMPDTLTIRREGFDTQNAKILDVNRELSGELYTVTIEYYDISEHTIAEHLKSEFLKTTKDQVYQLYYSPSDFIATRITPVQNFPEAEVEQTEQNDIKETNKSVLTEAYNYTFYCSEAEVIALRRGLNNYKPKVDGAQSLEFVNPEIEELEGWDIFKVNIDFIDNKEIYKL